MSTRPVPRSSSSRGCILFPDLLRPYVAVFVDAAAAAVVGIFLCYRSYFAAMMNLETKDGVLMLILGSMIHFLVIVWYKFKRYEVMLMGALDHAMVWQIGACASSP